MENPKISVIMSVYNGGEFIRETIESVLNQTYKNFEFLITDNASTDDTVEIIKSYRDSRIKLFVNEENKGYVWNLNQMIKIARGEYIAKQDADDISLPKRFELQVKFLDANQDIAVCGTYARIFGHKKGRMRGELSDNKIRTGMLFENQMVNSSTMIKKSILESENYFFDVSYLPTEDYKFWCEIQKKYKIENIPYYLVKYRTHNNNYGSQKKELQQKNIMRVQNEMFKYYFNSNQDIKELFSIKKIQVYKNLLNAIKNNNSFDEKTASKYLTINSFKFILKDSNITKMKKIKVLINEGFLNPLKVLFVCFYYARRHF